MQDPTRFATPPRTRSIIPGRARAEQLSACWNPLQRSNRGALIEVAIFKAMADAWRVPNGIAHQCTLIIGTISGFVFFSDGECLCGAVGQTVH